VNPSSGSEGASIASAAFRATAFRFADLAD
jgi:hypothetical protein